MRSSVEGRGKMWVPHLQSHVATSCAFAEYTNPADADLCILMAHNKIAYRVAPCVIKEIFF